ncbi:MAG: hypothetical protein BroJett040_00160 [Oligoflexia bacterium]|nr:MAG: hypothetical protein BroJett040_00160 [Oligoflexia bacterium]
MKFIFLIQLISLMAFPSFAADMFGKRQPYFQFFSQTCRSLISKQIKPVPGNALPSSFVQKIEKLTQEQVRHVGIVENKGIANDFSVYFEKNERKIEALNVYSSAQAIFFDLRVEDSILETIASVTFNKKCELERSKVSYFDPETKKLHYREWFDGKGKLLSRVVVNQLVQPLSQIYSPEKLDALNVPSESDFGIGIIDIGVDYNHPALAYKMRSSPQIGLDFVDEDFLPFDYTTSVGLDTQIGPFDHGTHVADLASRDLDVRVVPVRVGNAPRYTGAAIKYLVRRGVQVINMSMSSPTEEDWISFRKAAQSAPEVTFVIAAGNDFGRDLDQEPKYPSGWHLPNVICVASVNAQGELSAFSNFGAQTVHVAAVGESVLAATPGGHMGKKSGTSMATPQVTRLVAQMKMKNPKLTPTQIKEILIQTSLKSPSLSEKMQGGVINPEAALQAVGVSE